jgi:O-methyltransferase domain
LISAKPLLKSASSEAIESRLMMNREMSCQKILRMQLFAQMGEDHSFVRLLIPPGNEPAQAKFVGIIMMLMTRGRERTEEEYRSLLRSNGFELTQVIPTPSMLSIIEAVKL